MKTIGKILSLLMLLFLLTAEDCSNRSRTPSLVEKQLTVFEEVENEFVKDELEQVELEAFEERALQMMNELFEYLVIYTDSTLSNQFRRQAREMLVNSFVSEDDFQAFLQELEIKEDTANVVAVLPQSEAVLFNVESIKIVEPLKFSEMDYTGQLSYVLNSSKEFMNVRMLKSKKIFGQEKLNVWEICFEL